MKNITSIITCAILLLFASNMKAQKGTIRGSVIDDENGEPLIGAIVIISGTSNGAAADLDGKFSISAEAGVYELQVSYVSYQTLTIKDVTVKTGEVSLLENIRLKQKGNDLIEVIITAEAIRTSEASLLSLKRKSAVMMDGISSAQFKKVGDATAVEAAKRVTGVSIEDGKYVYVRGLGDRYSKTTLNGVDIPGLDPDRNSLQMDIFPTNLIDNMIVSKNFTADLPADFTGGLLNIETKDFPEEKLFNVSAGVAYNPDMHFNKDYLTYDGGKTDWLGFDDGTRALPSLANSDNIPTPISGASSEEVNAFVQSFNPQLAAKRSTSLLDYNAGISLGNQIELGKKKESDPQNVKPKLGYVFSASYKTTYRYYDDVMYGEYQRFIDPDKYEMRYATVQDGQLGEQNTLIGLLGGIAFKTASTKIKLNVMHLQSGESRAGKFAIDNDGQAVGQSGYFASSDNLEYNQRALSNVLLNGVHLLKKNTWEIDWRLSPTLSSTSDPDIRKTAFTETLVDTSFIAGAGGNPARIWRNLSEFNAVAKVDVTRNYKFKSIDAKFKFGASHLYKIRDYEILFFDIQFFGSQNWPNPDPAIVLDPENIYPGTQNNIYYQSGNANPNPNAYSSNVNNTAAYISNEMNITAQLKTILGLRAENYVQRHTGRDQRFANGDTLGGNNLVDEKVLDALDLFPSVNLIYSISEKQNLRLSYTKTIARPSFKELSFAQILDPVTNRIFNGSLFTYSDWDGKLVETRIDNIDIRWELFQERGQTFSVSGFYKNFDNPIEMVRIPEQQTSTEFQPRNVGNGSLYGVELELRKDLDFISPSLQRFNFNTNLTFVKSSIDMTDLEYNSRKSYEKTGQTIERTRNMAGQAPFVINAGFSYNNEEKSYDAGLFYNVKGPTLYVVGAGLFPDVYTEPFHSLNFSFNMKLGKEKNSTINIRVANILSDRLEAFYTSYEAEKQVFNSINPGRSFSLGYSHNF
jgi:TonB-dependent receptor